MRRALILIAAFAAPASPAAAEVVAASGNGFHLRHSVSLVVPTDQAYASFGRIGQWWEDSHTHSGSAANMSLGLQPGGCFCERLPDGGGVEHLRVVHVAPGERLVMTGSLGPLVQLATTGVMDVTFERIAGGTRVTMDYKVAGFATGGADALAPAVDMVLGAQMRRYRTYAASEARSR